MGKLSKAMLAASKTPWIKVNGRISGTLTEVITITNPTVLFSMNLQERQSNLGRRISVDTIYTNSWFEFIRVATTEDIWTFMEDAVTTLLQEHGTLYITTNYTSGRLSQFSDKEDLKACLSGLINVMRVTTNFRDVSP